MLAERKREARLSLQRGDQLQQRRLAVHDAARLHAERGRRDDVIGFLVREIGVADICSSRCPPRRTVDLVGVGVQVAVELLVGEVDPDLPRVVLENEAVRKRVAARQLELALRVVLLAQQRHEVGAAVVRVELEVGLRLFDFGRLQVWKELKSTCSHLLVEWLGGLPLAPHPPDVRSACTTPGLARWTRPFQDSYECRKKLQQ